MPVDPLLKSLPGAAGIQSAESAPASPEAARQREKLKKATQEFEAVFIGMMLKQMRKSLTGGGALFGSSNESKLYQDMLDDSVAQRMSQTGDFGLAKKLEESMARFLSSAAPEEK